MTTDAKLILDDQTISLPTRKGTLGESVIEIDKIKNNGYFTMDSGFSSTASCESKITYIDGEKGILLYRGYPIEQLAEHSSFLEVSSLLINGELPSPQELQNFTSEIRNHTMVKEQLRNFYNGFGRTAHPMSVLCGVTAALSSFYHDDLPMDTIECRNQYIYRAIAKMPTIIAMCYKYNISQPFMYPQNNLSYTENFLHMTFGIPCEEKRFPPEVVRALDIIFILHADHEQNASTSTVRMAGSTGANPFACMASGIATLWGPAHGGANEAVIKMLDTIGSIDNIDKYIAKAKDKKDPFRLMGFGHRVYKNFDPRATVLKSVLKSVTNTLTVNSRQLEIAHRLEEIALKDDYFIERNLYPNVDFYSGLIFNAMGFPTRMFTALFALARTVGWMSHWKEMAETSPKISRPRQLYTGSVSRQYPV